MALWVYLRSAKNFHVNARVHIVHNLVGKAMWYANSPSQLLFIIIVCGAWVEESCLVCSHIFEIQPIHNKMKTIFLKNSPSVTTYEREVKWMNLLQKPLYYGMPLFILFVIWENHCQSSLANSFPCLELSSFNSYLLPVVCLRQPLHCQ